MYTTVRIGGSDHSPIFTSKVVTIKYTGYEKELEMFSDHFKSKKEAENDAAQKLYDLLTQKVLSIQQSPTSSPVTTPVTTPVTITPPSLGDVNEEFNEDGSLAYHQPLSAFNADKGEGGSEGDWDNCTGDWGEITNTWGTWGENRKVLIFIDLENLNQTKEYEKLSVLKNKAIIIGIISEYHHLARSSFPFSVKKIKSNRQNVCDVALSMEIVMHLINYPTIECVVIGSRDNFAGACVDCINTDSFGLCRNVKAINAYDVQNILEVVDNHKRIA